jgi:hypothetical protein
MLGEMHGFMYLEISGAFIPSPRDRELPGEWRQEWRQAGIQYRHIVRENGEFHRLTWLCRSEHSYGKKGA